MKHSPELRIACHIQQRESYGHAVLRGILEWSRTQAKCQVINYGRMEHLGLLKPHGIIAQLAHKNSIAPALALKGIPILNISATLADVPFPSVTADNRAVGRSGALHLLSTGLADFAFARQPWAEYSRLRGAGFREAIEEKGGLLHEGFLMSPHEPFISEGFPHPPSMPRWLQGLPRPCGIMTDSEDLAVAITYCALRLKLRIPDDFALITADQQHLQCELAYPPISCVPLPGRTVGWRAAECMGNHILKGEPLPEVSLLIPPETVILRPSSDLLHVEDPALRRSLAYIREHGKTRITVPDVVAASGVNRRLLENKFKTILHRTILETVQSVHLQVALRMLRETAVRITDICYEAGFANPQRFNETIKAETGLTPLTYRKRHQQG